MKFSMRICKDCIQVYYGKMVPDADIKKAKKDP